jgi:Ni2+-binding GTPase involved in maturation of urease and hydrogenase
VTVPKLIIIGGFLGAGKTTLLGKARQEFENLGQKVGLITNDQAPGLADTAILGGDKAVTEVTGSCFCCNFPGFEKALSSLAQWGAEVILAEPVGSCTDLSATIMQPLKDLYGDKYKIAPFSVAVDPARAREVLGLKKSLLHKDALYILGLQLAEADVIVLNKIDLLSGSEKDELVSLLGAAYPQAQVYCLSAREGQGVGSFLEAILASDQKAGRTITIVDYDRYANGEAVLGWLNLTVDNDFNSRGGRGGLEGFLDNLSRSLESGGLETGHVKVLWPSPEGLWAGNITDTHQKPLITLVKKTASPGPILINARVESEPADLEKLIRTILSQTGGEEKFDRFIKDVYCLKPGRPNPTHRYTQVI